MEGTPQRVLVVTPHPDDAEIWCGGTLARWIKEGAEVHYLLCTNGGRCTDRSDITSKELSETREQEQLDAAQILGVKNVVMLHHPDGELEDTGDFRKEIVRQIRLVKPVVVLSTEPYPMNMLWHRDHRITGQVALDAVFPYARDHLHFGELWSEEGLEPHKVSEVWIAGGDDNADKFVDVEAYMDTAVKALKAHVSQVDQENAGDWVRQGRIRTGEKTGMAYAEGFKRIPFG